MKTLQEQDELIASNRLIFERNIELQKEVEILQKTINTLHNLCISSEKRALEKFKEEYPIQELVAVARAVQPIVVWCDHGDITCYRNSAKGNTAIEINCGEVVAIYDALQALRATGKVTL